MTPPSGPNQPPRTLSYARVSTLTQAETGFSLDAQRERARMYALAHNWPEPIHFSDDGVSGRRDTRPGLTALVDAVRPGDAILVKDVIRIGRGGAARTLNIIKTLEDKGGFLVFIDQGVSSNTPIGRMMMTLMAAFGELELERTREQSLAGRAQAARTGHWPSRNVPYGYRRNADRKLELDPATAPHARRALETLAGRSLRAAAKLLNDEGVPASKAVNGKGRWTENMLHDMLNNTIYIGKAKLRTGSEQHEVPCPPLIDQDLWAQLHMRATSAGGVGQPGRYPLTGHLRCPHGAPYTGHTYRNSGPSKTVRPCYAVATTSKRLYPGCTCGQRAAHLLEAEAREALARILEDPNDPAAVQALTKPEAEIAPDPLDAPRAAIRDQLSNLAQLQVKGQIDYEDYVKLRTELKAQEAKLKPSSKGASARTPIPAQRETAELVRAATPEELAQLLDLFQVRMVLHDRTRLEITSVTMLS